jgi:hypothetical protein
MIGQTLGHYGVVEDELARVPDFALEIGSKVAVFDPFDPKLQAVA